MNRNEGRWARLRRTLAISSLLLVALVPRAMAQEKTLTVMTWFMANRTALIDEWTAEFKKIRPDAKLVWIDKPGKDFAAYYQTQVIGGTPPDIIDVQGALWLEYAAGGGLVDLTPYLAKEPAVGKRFDPAYLRGWEYQGRNYMLPFYIAKTLLYYNKPMFKEAGLDGPPKSFDELISYSTHMAKGEKSGFITLNFDWLYWPLFKMNGVDLVTADFKKAAFNTGAGVKTLEALSAATASGAINKVSWTGRWVEPIGAFAGGNIGMFLANSQAFATIRSQGSWVGPDTLGVAQAPGGWATPNSHGLGISKGTKDPDLAWAFLKMVTDTKLATKLTEQTLFLSGNLGSDKAFLEKLKATDPLAATVLTTQVEMTDRLTGNWPLPLDARVKEAFYPELQNAVFGRKPAAAALKDAEAKVNRVLGQ